MVLDVADADVVRVLLDRRVGFKILDLFLGARAVVTGLDFAVNRDLPGWPGVDLDVARARAHFQVHRACYGKRAVK